MESKQGMQLLFARLEYYFGLGTAIFKAIKDYEKEKGKDFSDTVDITNDSGVGGNSSTVEEEKK